MHSLKVTDGTRSHLLRRRYALLLIKLGCLLRFDRQTQPLLEGLVLQHQCRAEPEVVSLPQVLQHTGAHGDRGDALGHGFHKAVQRTWLAVTLHLMTATAQERTDLPGQSLQVKGERAQVFIQDPARLSQVCGCTPVIPAPERLREEDGECKASLGYDVILGPAWGIC